MATGNSIVTLGRPLTVSSSAGGTLVLYKVNLNAVEEGGGAEDCPSCAIAQLAVITQDDPFVTLSHVPVADSGVGRGTLGDDVFTVRFSGDGNGRVNSTDVLPHRHRRS